MNAPDPVIIEALAKVKGRAHVLDMVYDAFNKHCTAKDFVAADDVVQFFMLSGHSNWVRIGALTASQEFKTKLPSRGVLYTLTFETLLLEFGAKVATIELEGLE